MPFAPLKRLPGQSIHEYRLMLAKLYGLQYGVAPRAKNQTEEEYQEILKAQIISEKKCKTERMVCIPNTNIPLLALVSIAIGVGALIGLFLSYFCGY